MMNEGERKLEYENFNNSMLPEEQEPGQEQVFQEKVTRQYKSPVSEKKTRECRQNINKNDK